jgi:hypothetical protein
LAHGPDHVIELSLIESARGQLALQFVQLLFGSRKPVLIGAKRECPRLYVLQIFADSRKEALPHVFAAESIVTVPVIDIIVARCTTTISIIPATTIAVVSHIPIAIIARTIISPLGARLPGRVRWWRSLTTRISAAPGQIERVSFRTVVRVFNANYRRTAVARIAYQRLPAAAIHA